jgi:hypothetical protein
MHGAGIAAMGFLMDAISDRFLPRRYPSRTEFLRDVVELTPSCRWTSGYWDFPAIPRKWNDLQNTPRDVQLLTDFLLSEYEARVLRKRVRVVQGWSR